MVKELIENSLDAGSTDICVNLLSGGLETIEVIDNGRGIQKNDLKAAITRHHTSKLDEKSDVLKISSLGFRGEALASITSVAEVELSSRHESNLYPWMLSTKPDSLNVEPVPSAGNIGTKICINNLFFKADSLSIFGLYTFPLVIDNINHLPTTDQSDGLTLIINFSSLCHKSIAMQERIPIIIMCIMSIKLFLRNCFF